MTIAGADPGIWKGGGAQLEAPRGGCGRGGTPPAQLGGMGERCKLPQAPEANAFCVEKAPKKSRLLNSRYIVYTCAMHVSFHKKYILVVATAKVRRSYLK